MKRTLSITYSSWPLEWSAFDKFATLAVFFDKVLLPCPYFFDATAPVLWTSEARSEIEEDVQADFAKWRQQIEPLIRAGLVEFLPPTIQTSSDAPKDFLDAVRAKLATVEPSYGDLPPGALSTNWHMITGAFTFALHALYAQKPAPELFLSDPSSRTTSRLAGYLVHSLFAYQVPMLSALGAEQILEVRDVIKDNREGFTGLIFELTDDVEARLKGGEASEAVAADKTVERKLLPKYEEFRRQIAAKETGFWGKVLARGGKLLQIDASPWTPKFYGGILEALFGSLAEAGQFDENALTSQGQAFQYLASLESTLTKRRKGKPRLP